jgi:hypothetical protein
VLRHVVEPGSTTGTGTGTGLMATVVFLPRERKSFKSVKSALECNFATENLSKSRKADSLSDTAKGIQNDWRCSGSSGSQWSLGHNERAYSPVHIDHSSEWRTRGPMCETEHR